MFCPTCGNELTENSKFCSKCGTAVKIPERPTDSIVVPENIAIPNQQVTQNQIPTSSYQQEQNQMSTPSHQQKQNQVNEKTKGKKKNRKKIIAFCLIIGVLLLAAGITLGVMIVNHNKTIDTFQKKVSEIKDFHNSNTIGIFEDEYVQLLSDCNTAIEKKQYSKIDELNEQIDSFTQKVQGAQSEANDLSQQLRSYQAITENYRIPVKYQSEYEQLCSDMEEQLSVMDIQQAKTSQKSLETLIQTIKEINEKFKPYISQYEYYQTAFDEYILSDEDENVYQDYLSAYNTAIEDLDLDACQTTDQAMQEYQTQKEKESKTKLNKQKQVMNEMFSYNSGCLCKAETEEIGNLQSEIQELISEGKYRSANAKYEIYNDLLSSYIHKAYGLDLTQVDLSEYPLVKLYLNLYDSNGYSVSTVDYDSFLVKEKMTTNSDYIQQTILKASILDGVENLNVNLVADVSASMSYQFKDVQSVMKNFLNSMQFSIGDQASIISFSDSVNSEIAFTSNYTSLVSTIDRLYMGNMTALYDALYIAILQTAQQSGAKCIMAFTDGNDNISSCTKEVVIEIAKRYNIPIYIIGIGNSIDENSLDLICKSTGGYYSNISYVRDMESIYSDIFRQQKDLYYIEYETKLPKDQLEDILSVYVKYQADNIVATTESEFVPEILLEAITSHAYDMDGFIFGNSDSRYLTAADLEGLTPEELRIARNEIYARRGRLFKDEYLQEYFNSKSWYKGTIKPDDFNENYFNDYEKANAYFIADFERLHGFIK